MQTDAVDGPTYCLDCDFVQDKKMAPYLWLCVKHPNISDGFGYVTQHTWDKELPYLKCKDVNGGACLLFEPAR